MARIRTIKPDFFMHGALYRAEVKHGVLRQLRVLYPALWTVADREGRFKWRPDSIKLQSMPYDQDVDIAELLEILAAEGFIVRYEVDGEVFGWIPTLKDHQRIRSDEAASSLPPPPMVRDDASPSDTKTVPTVPGSHLHSDGLLSAQIPIHTVEGKGKERKGRECYVGLQKSGHPPYQEIIDHLNQRAGTSFDAQAKATRALIKARWDEGHTLDQFKDVIDDRCGDWLHNDDMRRYLRPMTLFNAQKFESYLGLLSITHAPTESPSQRRARRLAQEAQN